jgi:hypothetical protein
LDQEMLKVLRSVVHSQRLVGSTASVRIRCSSLFLGRASQHSAVKWNSIQSTSKDAAVAAAAAAENSSTSQEAKINHSAAMDGNAVYPCFSDLDDLHFISKDILHRAGLERMTEIQFKTWGPVLEGRGMWMLIRYSSSSFLCNNTDT